MDINTREMPDLLTFSVNGVPFKMIKVEGGSFRMGSDKESQTETYADEVPAHCVEVGSFFLGETVVTQALWKVVMGVEPAYLGGWIDEYGRGDEYPAYRLSWNDSHDFIQKLNQVTGKTFVHPTEAEWEYAARGGKRDSGSVFAGSDSIDEVAWYYANGAGMTHPVKRKSPNELGLYDMSGNVWEWCQDWYGAYDNGSQTNPVGPSSGSCRVLRGGSWDSLATCCRITNRNHYNPTFRCQLFGLRLALRLS